MGKQWRLTREQDGLFSQLSGGVGFRRDRSQTFQSLVLDQTLEYKNAWEGGHLLDAIVGISFTKDRERYFTTTARGFESEKAIAPESQHCDSSPD